VLLSKCLHRRHLEFQHKTLESEKLDTPSTISFKNNGKELIVDYVEDDIAHKKLWKLLFRKFTIETLKTEISLEWHVPIKQIEVNFNVSMPGDTAYKFPENKIIQPPFEY
jgi:hypothetical protein